MKSLEAPVVTFSWPKITSSATLQTILAHAVQHFATSEMVDAEVQKLLKQTTPATKGYSHLVLKIAPAVQSRL
jgi:hypothetical protein